MNETIPLPRPRKSFSNFDKLGFEDFAVNLTSFIETERDFVDEALLISLHGKFGQGKSTFFEMWKEYLVTERPPRFAVISLNAWEADYDRDPLLAIVMGFVKHFENEGQQEESEQLKKIGGRVAKFSASIANQVVRALTKIDLLKAKEDSEEHETSILDRACFEEYADRQEGFRGLKILLREAVKQSPLPIIVMVDELDRCRPDYAVEYLETIKHIFDLDGLVFVLGVDRQSLSSSVRALFGESLKFDEYFRKFVHRNVNLPSFEGRSPENHIQYNQIKKFVRHLVSQYLVSDSLAAKGRYCYLSWNDDQLKRVTNLCLDLKMSPRQVHEAFRVMAHSLKVQEEKVGSMRTFWEVGAMFMASLSASKTDLYHKIGQGRLNPQSLIEFLKDTPHLMDKNHSKLWWTSLIFLGATKLNESSIESLSKILKAVSTEEESGDDLESLKRFAGDFQMDFVESPLLQEVYKVIESVRSFAS